jgi:uncharacterized protein (DUF433 family)
MKTDVEAQVISRSPDIMSGAPVFIETYVQRATVNRVE